MVPSLAEVMARVVMKSSASSCSVSGKLSGKHSMGGKASCRSAWFVAWSNRIGELASLRQTHLARSFPAQSLTLDPPLGENSRAERMSNI